MRSVFIDTSFVIVIFTPEDRHHKQALEIAHKLFDYTEIWITDAVIYEIGNSFSKTGKQIIAEFIRDCYSTEQIQVVKTDEPLLMKALTHYSDYLDKDWSTPYTIPLYNLIFFMCLFIMFSSTVICFLFLFLLACT